jgi:NADH-quinone oxidoreductase subunit L
VSDPIGRALLILGLPLAAAVLAAIFSRTALRKGANWPLIAACAGAAGLAIGLLSQVAAGDPSPGVPEADKHRFISDAWTWFAAGKFVVNFVIAVDPLAAIMLATVTFVSLWIAFFSTGYMHGDRGFGRFFAVMSLFVFSMCGLVLANNFLLLLAFWEGVGLCSYLLVGYYFDKPSAAAAARKAFLVTRLGDVGFILGIFLLWRMTGFATTELTTAFEIIAAKVKANPGAAGELTTACLLLFCGAVGKSAQFPLYVWLPDAMEGPTPVSALIHAATMVTAGVYLVARCAPLFALCPEAQIVVASIGGITAILAAFIALAQTDLKRVLAYSTVSQLGFMFLALGTMGAISPTFAVTAAIFHLFTHAFFKALLFLSAGSVMHAMGGVIDVRQFGGLRKLMPVTHLTFLCGAAALAGVPLLSGFWSKDLILESLSGAAEGTRYAWAYSFLFVVALVTAFLTAFYTFRAYFLTFWGPQRVPPEAGHHAHESPKIMTVPLLVLAVGALIVGIAVEPFNHAFSHYLGETPGLKEAAKAGGNEIPHEFNSIIAGLSTALALAGIALALAWYRNGEPATYPKPVERVFSLSRNKLYVEDAYEAAVVKPAEGLSFLAKAFDGFLDALARLFASVPKFFAQWARPVQNGLVQFYALSMALGLAVFLAFVLFRVTR